MEGKGKDPPRHVSSSSDTPAPEGYSQNISQRLWDSASGLLRDTISSNHDDSARALAHALASQGKAGPSTTASAQPGNLGEPPRSINGKQYSGSTPHSRETFRESSADRSSNSEFGGIGNIMSLDDFIDSAQHENVVPNWQHNSTAKGKQKLSSLAEDPADHRAADSELPAVWDSTTTNHTRGQAMNGAQRLAEISESDGADVVKLLQDPNLTLWSDEAGDEEDIPYTITEEDSRIAELLRNIGTNTVSKPSYESAISAAKHGEPFKNFSSFFDDVENYQDEVWGYIQPLVEKAKRESTVQRSADEEEGPATRRLRMILAHIDGSR